MKKDIVWAIITGIGLSFIFCYASHSWAGIICGICYVIGFVYLKKRNSKNEK